MQEKGVQLSKNQTIQSQSIISQLHGNQFPNYQSYQSYINMPSNEPGNIFLDQPMVQTNYMQSGEQYVNSPEENKGNVEMLNTNTREINYNMNPRDLKEGNYGGFTGKMSPNKNVDDESLSDKNDNPNPQLKDLKAQMERDDNIVKPDIDGINENPEEHIQNEIEKINEFNKIQKQQNYDMHEHMTEAEIKKLIKQMTKGYDPKKNKRR
jgi:hypothetical protein